MQNKKLDYVGHYMYFQGLIVFELWAFYSKKGIRIENEAEIPFPEKMHAHVAP
jgi:hypothetical protein